MGVADSSLCRHSCPHQALITLPLFTAGKDLVLSGDNEAGKIIPAEFIVSVRLCENPNLEPLRSVVVDLINVGQV